MKFPIPRMQDVRLQDCFRFYSCLRRFVAGKAAVKLQDHRVLARWPRGTENRVGGGGLPGVACPRLRWRMAGVP